MICSSLNRFFTSNLLSFGIGLLVPLLLSRACKIQFQAIDSFLLPCWRC